MKMGTQSLVSVKIHRNENIMANKSVPILFIIVCFLVIANTRCDSVGSANVADSRSKKVEMKTIEINRDNSASNNLKNNLLNNYREIYLDQDSKVTMFLPMGSDSVQKFHPNGRYGRSSVNDLIEPASAHTEFGQLRIPVGDVGLKQMLRALGSSHASNKVANNNRNNIRNLLRGSGSEMDELAQIDTGAMNEVELGKLLKCNFSGVSNLYWCNNVN